MASVILAESASINGAAAPPSPAGAPNKALKEAFLEFDKFCSRLSIYSMPDLLNMYVVLMWLDKHQLLTPIEVCAAAAYAYAEAVDVDIKSQLVIHRWNAINQTREAFFKGKRGAVYTDDDRAKRDELNDAFCKVKEEFSVSTSTLSKANNFSRVAQIVAAVVSAFHALTLAEREAKIQSAKDYKASVFVSANSCMCGGRCPKHSSLLKQFE
jgi:hypothetical protein